MRITVVLAAHNEEENIAELIDRIQKSLPSDHTVILVDDGSSDRTAEIAKQKTGVRLINNDVRKGKGYTIRKGVEQASGYITVFIDCDLQDLPEDIPKLIDAVNEGNDLVIGSKFIGECRPGAISKLNSIGNRFMTSLINILFRTKMTDSQSGFKAILTDKLKAIPLSSDEYEIETELLLKAIKMGYRVKEIPVVRDSRKGGSSGFKRFRNGSRVLFTILKERFVP